MNKLNSERKSIFLCVIVLTFGLALTAAQSEKKEQKPKPFDVIAKFCPSGWMGDLEKNPNCVDFSDGWRNGAHSAPLCVKVTYTFGPKGWAGIYWHNKPNNWGEKPGSNFQKKGYKKITFWAKGEKGGEVIEFKAGGIDNTSKTPKGKYKYKDSFEVIAGKIPLEKNWKQYTIDMEDEDISSVIGGFCWTASKISNPEVNIITFYIDDVYYE